MQFVIKLSKHVIGDLSNILETQGKATDLKDEIFPCMWRQVSSAGVFFPKRLKGINNPVVFLKEECVYGQEGRLYHSSDISAGQIVWRWVAHQWGSKATLTSAW